VSRRLDDHHRGGRASPLPLRGSACARRAQQLNFVWLMAAHREREDRVFGVVDGSWLRRRVRVEYSGRVTPIARRLSCSAVPDPARSL
jgi:hypothetical protein